MRRGLRLPRKNPVAESVRNMYTNFGHRIIRREGANRQLFDDHEIAQRLAPASSSVGSPSGFSPASFSPTIVEKLGGVAGIRDVTPVNENLF